MCVSFGFHRSVGGAVFSRLVVGSGVDAEHTEVASLAWPHPVVGFATELAQALRRGEYQPDVIVLLIYVGEESISCVVGADFADESLIFVEIFIFYPVISSKSPASAGTDFSICAYSCFAKPMFDVGEFATSLPI